MQTVKTSWNAGQSQILLNILSIHKAKTMCLGLLATPKMKKKKMTHPMSVFASLVVAVEVNTKIITK